MDDQPLIELRGVTKIYPLKSGDVTALDNISLIHRDFVVIMGPSGSGKPLRNCDVSIALLPAIFDAGRNTRAMDDHELTGLLEHHQVSSRSSTSSPPFPYENVEYPI